MLKALVIHKNERVTTQGDLLQIARSIVKTIEHSKGNIPILTIVYIPEFDCHVALYEKPEHKGSGARTRSVKTRV